MADKLKETSEGSASGIDDTKPSRKTTRASGNKTARDGSHGLKFESKLLPLFCIRGLGAGYKFQLGRENENLAGKFDDVIFRYEVADDRSAGKHWRYLYLQAKHKENKDERKITANDLLDPKGNGQFSLKKYFLSYCKMRARGDDVRDCIMCTNWGVNEQKFHKIKLEKVTEPHDILTFASEEISVNIYKLQIDKVLHVETLKLLEKSDNEAMGVTDSFNSETLEDEVYEVVVPHTQDSDNKKKDLDNKEKKPKEKKIFKPNFLNDKNLSVDAQNFRQKICELIDDFIKKFILVVDMPNETQFKKIIETEDISKYYQSNQCENQTIRIIDKISSAFEGKPAEFWLTSEEGKKILLAGVTDVSLEDQRKLNEKIGFNDTAIQVMKKKLRQLIDSPGNEKVQRIFTPSPQFTAVKVISAIKILLEELKQELKEEGKQELKEEGNYLVVPSSLLQNKEEMKRWKNILKLQKGFHHFLVVVCDNEASAQTLENLFADHHDDKNFGIIISRGEELAEKEEEIKYTDLTEDFQNKILSKIVSLFQEEEKTLTVRDLVGDKPEEVIDSFSLEELLSEEKEIKIPSFNTSNFEFYIKRRLRFPFDGQFEIGGKCKINPDGHIKWFVEEKKRTKVWQKIKDEITNRASSTHKIVDDSDLIKEKSIVIISEVAGSGKSTILSHFYNEIKEKKPDHWVIRINLLDQCEKLKKLDKVEHLGDAVNFLVNQLHVVDEKSSFSRSLLKNRLETGDRIVFMFDGYDEINDTCQEKAIRLMKAITKEKAVKLFVTTRPQMLDYKIDDQCQEMKKEKRAQFDATTRTHIFDKLPFELSHLAYSLENFTENDQINFLVSNWKKELKLKDEYILHQFAKSLVKRVSETLNDKEKTFFGIPLQSQILALNFQSNISELIATGWTEQEEELLIKRISDLLANQKFDFLSLFERLMEEKSRIFREKAKAADNDIQKSAIKLQIKAIEDHLTRLAIETIVTDQEITRVLWPPQSLHRSDEDLADEEKDIASIGLKFGLTKIGLKFGDKIQFLHRTIAEYLFALFLYKGFLLDDKRHNKLLENESIRRLILKKILSEWKYNVVQVFFDGMLKKIVDDDEKWRNINTRQLPDRLKNFIHCFCNQFFPSKRGKRKNALLHSLVNGNIKIFTFICDCLDSTLNETQIETVMMECFILEELNFFSFELFRTTESKVFKRFIGYFKKNTRDVLLKLDPFWDYSSFFGRIIGSENSRWNGKDKTVGIMFQLIENELSSKDKKPLRCRSHFCYTYTSMFDVLKNVFTFSMIHENYENLLNKLKRVLAQVIDDSDFTGLLKKLFRFKNKHLIISGRIEKALAIFRDLKQNELLIEIRRKVFKIDPDAFQKIYLLVKGEDVTAAMDLKMLMKRNAYGMTSLHRAAFYGDTKEVDQIFEKLSQYQENETKRVMAEFMLPDKNGVTPIYIAAARGHEEIYSKMLAFVKQNLPSCIYEHLTCRYRFELRLLHNAINSKDIEMFQIILKAVKKESAPLEFIQVLCRPKKFCVEIYGDENRGRESIFEWIQNSVRKEKFFNAMVKSTVTRNDGRVKDYTDLYDLIFHDEETGEILRYIDGEDLQGLLSLKGVANFTQQLVNNKNKTNWLQLQSELYERATPNKNLIGLLRHFTKDQLVQLVDTIPSKNTVTIDREINEYDFSDIFDYLEKREVGDDCLKKFLLYEDRKGFVMIRLPIKDVKRMFTCLSEERQEEIKQKWNNTTLMRMIFSLTDLELKSEYMRARYWANILMFYLEFGSKENLTEFVEIVTVLRKVEGKRCSVLSLILEYCDEGTTLEILKLVSEKEEQNILVPNAVKTIMIHEIDEIPFIIKLMLLGKDIDKWLGIFPPKKREEIQGFLKSRASKFIDKAFSEPQTLYFRKRIQTLISFLNYSNKEQLETFVHNITFIPNIDISKEQKKRNDSDDSDSDPDSSDSDSSSIWDEVLKYLELDVSETKTLMKCVSEKLGSNAVKELILHKYNEKAVIFHFAEREKKEIVLEAVLKYLSAEDRKEIQRQIDETIGSLV